MQKRGGGGIGSYKSTPRYLDINQRRGLNASVLATLCCENVMNEHRWTDSGGDDIDDSAGDCGRRHHVTDDDECSRTRIVVDENEPEIGT